MTEPSLSPDKLTLYGADWCGDCRRAKAVLAQRGIAYHEVDLVASPEKADEAEALSGRKNIPVLLFPDGDVFVEPSNVDLNTKLDDLGW